MSDRYAVMGNPVAHSKSPFIHAHFARQSAQDLRYEALLVPRDGFARAVREFFAAGGKGLNITVPFKQEAWVLAQVRSRGAELAGAVNTLRLNAQGVLEGHNTDGPGLVRDLLHNAGGELRGKRVLVLGAGGATRGIVQPLLAQAPCELVIANRTESKARELAALFAPYGSVIGCGYDALRGQRFDWVLNATAASLEGTLPPLPDDLLAADAWCYDLMYAKDSTIFCRWAQQHGAARALDGLGMLVEQAAEAFLLWRGLRPDTGDVLRVLRAS
ncbi:MAG: shikimate dehydrogenase [Pseudomonadales bacterium]|jgi:shikimate dehydrogenase|nr:shikimate dehydrogenase [Pseudomonadales bacterium]